MRRRELGFPIRIRAVSLTNNYTKTKQALHIAESAHQRSLRPLKNFVLLDSATILNRR